MQIVIFQIGKEKYAVDTSKIQGINKISEITNVPGAGKSIKGLVNLRGNIITLINPCILLSIDEEETKPENIMIVDTEEEELGIIVDKVTEVMDIDSNDIKNVSAHEGDLKYLRGIINYGDSLVTLVDVEALLSIK